MNNFKFKATEKFNNYTILNFLKLQGVSSEIIKKVKFTGLFLNGKKVKDINAKLNVLDEVEIVFSETINAFAKTYDGELLVLYEDEYFLVAFKESGVLTHSSKYNQTKSLEGLVYNKYKDNPFTYRPINRLDKDTSGLVIIAKDEFSASLLNEQIKSGEIKKRYIAKVKNKPTSNHFIIEKKIARESENSIKRIISDDGKYAKTECFYLGTDDNGLHVLEVLLHTGRTHQIRVHLQSVDLPLYADSLYGERVEGKTYYLNAYKLEFYHPFTKEKLKITAPII